VAGVRAPSTTGAMPGGPPPRGAALAVEEKRAAYPFTNLSVIRSLSPIASYLA
jgi:hypothetical protein